jgi:hypothetical protein
MTFSLLVLSVTLGLVLVRIEIFAATLGKFVSFQHIPTVGAMDLNAFSHGNRTYLIIANDHGDRFKPTESEVLVQHHPGAQFETVQLIPTNSVRKIDVFLIDGEAYLSVANVLGDLGYIMKFDPINERFVHFQNITTNMARQLMPFSIHNKHYLAVANHAGQRVELLVFNKSANQFVAFQNLPVRYAISAEFFSINHAHYLLVTSKRQDARHKTVSEIYRMEGAHGRFASYQSIQLAGANAAEFFAMGSDSYIAVANGGDGANYHVNTMVYKWCSHRFAL